MDLKLKLGDYTIDNFAEGKVVESEGGYFLLFDGKKLPIKAVAQSPDGSKAVVSIKRSSNSHVLEPSPIDKKEV